MKIEKMVGIFLTHEDELLMMHRSESKELAPGLWAIVSGHMEKEDFTPKNACLRELHEEAGIIPDEITGLSLRYIVFHKTDDTLHVIYDFSAKCKQKKPLPDTDEGSLHWVNKIDLLNLPMPPTMKLAMEHYLKHPMTLRPLAGIVRIQDAEEIIDWQPL